MVLEVDFGHPRGSNPAYVRPAVVVTADAILARGPRTLNVVPVTTTERSHFRTDVALDAMPSPSFAQCHLLTVVDASEQVADFEKYPQVSSAELAQIRETIKDVLDQY